MIINIPEGKKIYFLSDFHLGIPMDDDNAEREKDICNFLLKIAEDAYKIYFVGDIFDAWFEYKTVIPKGFARFFGVLMQLKDKGIIMDYFIGNHDMWINDYFQNTFGMTLYKDYTVHIINDKKVMIGHGDGLGPGDKKYKVLKKILRNPFLIFFYKWIHPDIGLRLAQYFSRKGSKHHTAIHPYLGDDKEWLYQFAKNELTKEHYDYFIFGHRHLPIEKKICERSTYINLGDWIIYNTYAVFSNDRLALKECKAFSSK